MTNLIDALHIPDTQGARDDRQLAIQRVGIRSVRYPLQLKIEAAVVPTVAEWSLDVALPAEQKGTHMSRFVAWLDAIDAPLDVSALRREAARMLELLHADAGRIEASFPFFLRKRAPVSGVESLLEYHGRFIVETRNEAPTLPSVAAPRGGAAGLGAARHPADPTSTVWLEVVVPVKSLCPCSKEISDYGAHNQRSHVTIRVEALAELPWRELVRFAEDEASAEIWSSLKRADEKWITERAYENPKFVEDMVRDVALRLNADPRIGRYSVDVENFESIHAHSAVARIER
jgi:GTP cyclohydrolase I